MGIRKDLTKLKLKLKLKNERNNLLREYAHNACDIEFDWEWKSIRYNRIALVNSLVAKVGGPDISYLEIGCFGNALFDAVFADRKIGVDPAKGGTHRMTSDAFFEQNEEMFDVVFVDGLHQYEQVRRDAVNTLKFLKPGGWVAFHDLLPRTWKEHHVPMLQDSWTGDCWKIAFELARSEDIDFKLLKIDHGVGVMRPQKEGAEIVDNISELIDQQFDYFAKNIDELPLCDWQEARDWIQQS